MGDIKTGDRVRLLSGESVFEGVVSKIGPVKFLPETLMLFHIEVEFQTWEANGQKLTHRWEPGFTIFRPVDAPGFEVVHAQDG